MKDVSVDGIPNKVYSRGMETGGMWEEVFKRFGKEKSEMDATSCYAGDRLALFIDLWSMRDIDHESGLRLMNKKEGVQLAIKSKASTL